jgi:WD40 repeat protein
MVLVFSSHANDSQQIPHEVAYAVSAKVAVIQLRIEDVEPNDNLRYFLDTSQWLDAFASPFAQHLERIAEAVKGTLEQPREAAHPLLLRKASKWGLAHGVIASHWRSLAAGLGLIGFVAFVARSIANATNPTVVSIAKFGASVKCVTFSPNGRYVAAGALGWDGGVKVFEAVGGREVSRVKVDDSDAADAVAFSPNGRYIAVGSNNIVRMFEALGGKIVSQLDFRDLVLAVVFGPEGRLVAVSSDDMTVRVFEAVTGRQVWLLEVEVPVVALAFSPDGRYVAAGSKDNTTRVFEAASGKELSRLECHNRGQIGAVAFSPDGHYVGVASSDETARVFETVGDTEAWLLKFQGWFARVGL